MAKNLYITTTEPRSGKSAIALGLMQLLMRDIRKVGFFRPIINTPSKDVRDHDINLIQSQFHLDMEYEEAFAFTLQEAKDLLNSGKQDLLFETILKKYKEIEAKCDFVLCEGSDFQDTASAFEFDINAEIAANLGAPLLLVANGYRKTAQEVVSSTQLALDSYEDKSVDILATIINRAAPEIDQGLGRELSCATCTDKPMLVYVIPEEDTLGKPTMSDVKKWLQATVLYGEDRMENLISDNLVAAMQIGNFLDYINHGSLVITPGDRSDIILSSLASRLSSNFPDIAGILLTGGIYPSKNVLKLIDGWTGVPMPVMLAKEHTYRTTRTVDSLYGKIEPDNPKKIATSLGVFEANVNTEELRLRLVETKSTKVTPRMFEYSLVEKAKANKQRIVLPEGSSDRVLRGADILLRRGVCDLTILGDPSKLSTKASELGLDLSAAELINPTTAENLEDYAATYFELRKHKGVTEEQAKDALSDPTYFATMMVHKDHAAGMVSGSITTTQQTILPAFQIIKTKPGASIVSSVFLMCLRDRVLVYGDCAVNPNPNAQQLAEIALSSAETARIFGVEPKVALLSYSTGASGKGDEVEKVREATKLAKERWPELLLEGPLQYDAAIDPEVAKTKMPDSKVAGQATVFIFPDLNTGNNTYKAVQRSAQAVAIGPVLQGLNKPVNDLSRGCTITDIVNTVAITAIQAQAEKGLI
ncbi:MAG: phosphate acetyltransferase [Desulfohalobium sp.]